MKLIDTLLDKITMYRLLLYYLILLIAVSIIYGFLHILPYNPFAIVLSAGVLTLICLITNTMFAKVYNAPTNFESVYISAGILTLILSPIKSVGDLPFYVFAGVLAMASKYILTISKKHIFNPVAIAVVLTAYGFGGSASWWIGTLSMLPWSLLGLLIVRKIERGDLVFYFFATSLVTMIGATLFQGGNILQTLKEILISSPIFFFAFIMLTEPLTTPPTKKLQAVYGGIVGILFAPQFHIGSFYTTPELSLVIGNVFSYVVSPKIKIVTMIKEKIPYGSDMIDFLFPLPQKLSFTPGQYMEWTMPHKGMDSRGNRRYFTIASSPTEDTLRLGVKFYPKGSSFKKTMKEQSSVPIVGSQISGDFTLPKNKEQKMVFIAGGIGITPFRSMMKYLVDTKEKRDVVLLYANKTKDEIMYRDVFTEAEKTLGSKIIYTLTDATTIPTNWTGEKGRIDQTLITREIPDYMERMFYLSGPHQMVTSYEDVLKKMGISHTHIKVDFFPGFA